MRASAISLPLILASAALVLAPARRVAAADVELPPQIPTAKLTQQVGLTEIAVEYDCPAVQGRKIWGGVVPYDRPWTVGGHAGVKVKLGKEVRIGDRAVPPGAYWLVALPGKSAWTLMLNKGSEPRSYKPELDVVRVKAAPKAIARRERLIFTFSDITDDRASLDLEWDTVRVSLPIQVNTTQQILASISGLDGTWRAFANAARYMLETTKDFDAGLKYIDQALALKDDWYCMWVKGALLAAKGDYRAAREWAVRARDLSEKTGNLGPLAPDLNGAIADWTRKSGGRLDAEAQAPKELQPAPKEAPQVPQIVPQIPQVNEAHALRKVGDGAPASVPAVAEPPAAAPAAPVFKAAAEKESPRPPAGDPPLVRRARLRRR